MDNNLKYSLLTTVIALLVISVFSFTAVLH